METYIIIVAGGSGARMGLAVPKQFLDLAGKPVLYHTLRAFHEALPHAHLRLVLPESHISMAQSALIHFPDRLDLTIAAGGETRFHSVRNGLAGIPEDALVLVHDGVRPLCSADLIRRMTEAGMTKGAAVPVVPVTDTLVVFADDGQYRMTDRNALRAVQTPQVFHARILHEALAQPWQESFTDEGAAVAALGVPVSQEAGERDNIKITVPEDLAIAEALLAMRHAR